jgi:phytoene dehydrogenase-like protein
MIAKGSKQSSGTVGSGSSDRTKRNPHVVIVGAGLSGLACARQLTDAGIQFTLTEAGDVVGGRVRTDDYHGFQLDRGFQVFLESYPEARRVLDYSQLRLRRFYPGAIVRVEGGFHLCPDPFRSPEHLLSGLMCPIGSIRDKLRVLSLRREVLRRSVESLFEEPEATTMDYLRQRGFSERMISRFFVPFYGGVFLDRGLQSSAKMFLFLFRMFATGYTAVPAAGMAAIPLQLASKIPPARLRIATAAQEIVDGRIRLSNGEKLRADEVVIATERSEADSLTGTQADAGSRAVTCLYFAARQLPFKHGAVVLNGEDRGVIHNLAFMSQIAPEYGNGEEHLVSVTVLPPVPHRQNELVQAVCDNLRDWFGDGALRWRHLKTYHLSKAQPILPPGTLNHVHRTRELGDGKIVCGDHRDTVSINGALTSGRHAAELVLKRLGRKVG